MKRIQMAVLGYGRVGKMHVKLIQHYCPELQIRAIIDDCLSNAKPLEDIKAFQVADTEHVLEDASLEAVFIASPSNTHAELIKKAIKHGKHIFCEKPVSFDISTLNTLIRATEKNHIKLQVGLNRRFDPDFLLLKDKISNNELGQISLIKITNRDPIRPSLSFAKRSGGLFLDFNIHDFDMAHFLTGSTVQKVYAQGSALIDSRLSDINDIDTAIISLTMQNGILVSIDSSRETNYGYDQRVEVMGSQGALVVTNQPQQTNEYTSSLSTHSALPKFSFIERYQNAYINQLRAFIHLLQSKEKNIQSLATLDDMKHAVEVALAANHSCKTNKPVSLSHHDDKAVEKSFS